MTAATQTPKPDSADIRRALALLHEPGEVFEIRVLGGGPPAVRSGYFDDYDEATAAALDCARRAAEGVYVTLNPVKALLLTRGANKLRAARNTATTADADITWRRWLFIDVDPRRPSGISSTDDEHDAAIAKAREIAAYLASHYFPSAVLADSGNGAHLLYKVDLPPDDNGLLSRVLTALHRLFSDERVKVDTGNFNPARIGKLYGTPARKGDSTGVRPHRPSRLIEVPADLEYVPKGRLEEIAEFVDAKGGPQSHQMNGSDFDVRGRLVRWGVEVLREESYGNGVRLILPNCPFGEHRKEAQAAVVIDGPRRLGFHCFSDDHAHLHWKDLRELYEPRAAVGQHANHSPKLEPTDASLNGAGGARVEGYDWPEPEEIGGELLAVPNLKETLIPEALRSWVLDTAERFQCPPDYFAAAALVEAGQLLGRKIAIRPKQHDNWYEHANLWGGIVAPPGFMKSPAIREAFHPLFRLERKARTEYDDAKRTAEVDREIAESNRTIIRNRLRGKDLNDGDRERFARQLSEVTFEEPVCRRYIVNDVTVEKVGELLNQNPNGLGLLCDELSGWMGQMEQPEYVNARAFYLSAWSGKTAYTYDRIGRGSLFIEAACLSVFGALVPGTLERYLRATFSGERADGFIQRFQLLVYPDLPSRWVYVDRPIEEAARARAFHVLERLGSLTSADFHAVEVEEEAPFVRFTAAAQSVWMGAHEWCMGLARSKDEHPVLRSHFSKYPKLLAALALLFHGLRLADGHAIEAIEKESIDLAWAWAQYLEGHARRIYQLALNPGETAARLIAEKLREQRLPNPFSVRELQHKEWTGLRAKGDVLAGLEVLEECSWVRSEPPAPGKTGRPSSRFWINPKVWK